MKKSLTIKTGRPTEIGGQKQRHPRATQSTLETKRPGHMVKISSALRFSSADFCGKDVPAPVKTKKSEKFPEPKATWFIHTPQTKHPVNKSVYTSHSF